MTAITDWRFTAITGRRLLMTVARLRVTSILRACGPWPRPRIEPANAREWVAIGCGFD